jgi:hypothetical protein
MKTLSRPDPPHTAERFRAETAFQCPYIGPFRAETARPGRAVPTRWWPRPS